MPQVSSARFMLLFAAVSIGTSLAGSCVRWTLLAFGGASSAGGIAPIVSIVFMSAIATAWLQSRILARLRSPLRGWTLASGLGALAGRVLAIFTAREVLRLILADGIQDWLLPLSRSVTGAACLGTAQALVIWGRRWTSDTLLWLIGLSIVFLLAEALAYGLLEASELGRPIPYLNLLVIPPLSAAVVGAGTAWLLDRVVFRAQPLEAGGRTVE